MEWSKGKQWGVGILAIAIVAAVFYAVYTAHQAPSKIDTIAEPVIADKAKLAFDKAIEDVKNARANVARAEEDLRRTEEAAKPKPTDEQQKEIERKRQSLNQDKEAQ